MKYGLLLVPPPDISPSPEYLLTGVSRDGPKWDQIFVTVVAELVDS
jgi:hypothetical protein